MIEIHSQSIYTFRETRGILKVSQSTLIRMIKKGEIRAAKVGKQYRILGSEILRQVNPELKPSVTAVRPRNTSRETGARDFLEHHMRRYREQTQGT